MSSISSSSSRGTNSDIKTKHKMLEDKYKQLKEEFDKQDEEIKKLNETIRQNKNIIDDQNNKINIINNKYQESLGKIEVKELQILELTDMLEIQGNQIIEETNRTKSLHDEIRKMRIELEEKSSKRVVLKGDRELIQQIKELQQKNKKLVEKQNELEEAISEITEENDKLKFEKSTPFKLNISPYISESASPIKTPTNVHFETPKKVDMNLLSPLIVSNKKLNQEVRKLKMENKNLEENLSKRSKELDKIKENLTQEIEHLKGELTKYTKSHSEAGLIPELEDAKLRLRLERDLTTQLQTVITDKEEEVRTLLKETGSDYMAKIEKYKNDLALLGSKVEIGLKKNDDIQKHIEDLVAEFGKDESQNKLKAKYVKRIKDLKSKITALFNKIDELSRENEGLQSIISDKDKEIILLSKRFDSDLSTKDAEIKGLTTISDDLSESVEELNSKTVLLRDENGKPILTVKDMEGISNAITISDNNNFNNIILELKKKIDDLMTKNNILIEENNNNTRERDELSLKEAKLRKDLADKQLEIENLNSKINEIGKYNTSPLTQPFNKTIEELEELKRENKILNENSSKLLSENAQLLQIVKESQVSLTNQLNETTNKKKDIKHKLKEQKKYSEELRYKLSSTMKQINRLDTEMVELAQQKDDLEKLIHAKDIEIEKLIREKDEVVEALTDYKNSEDFGSQKEHSDELNKLNNREKELDYKLSTTQSEKEELEANIRSLDSDKELITKQLSELTKGKDKLRTGIEKSLCKIEQLEKHLLKASDSSTSKLSDDSISDDIDLKKEYNHIKKQYNEVIKEKQNLVEQLNEALTTLERAQEQKDELEKQFNEEKFKLEYAIEDLKYKLNERNEVIHSHNSSLEQLRTLTRTCEVQTDLIVDINKKSSKVSTEASIDVQSSSPSKQRIATFASSIMLQKYSEIDTSIMSNEQKDDMILELKKDLTQFNNENGLIRDHLNKKISENQSLNYELKELRKHFAKLQDTSEIQKLEEVVHKQNIQINDLQQRNAQIYERNVELENSLADKEEKIRSLENNLISPCSESSKSPPKKKLISPGLMSDIHGLHNQLNVIENKINAKIEENMKLSQDIAKLQDKINTALSPEGLLELKLISERLTKNNSDIHFMVRELSSRYDNIRISDYGNATHASKKKRTKMGHSSEEYNSHISDFPVSVLTHDKISDELDTANQQVSIKDRIIDELDDENTKRNSHDVPESVIDDDIACITSVKASEHPADVIDSSYDLDNVSQFMEELGSQINPNELDSLKKRESAATDLDEMMKFEDMDLESLLREIQSLKDVLSNERKLKEKEISELHKDVEMKESEIQNLRKANDDLQELVKELTTVNKDQDMTQAIFDLENELVMRSDENERLQEKVQKYEQLIDGDGNILVDKYTKIQNDLSIMVKKHEEVKKSLEQKTQENADMVDKFENVKKSFEEKLIEMKEQEEHLIDTMHQVQDEKANLEEELAKSNKINSNLKDVTESLREDLFFSKSQLKEKESEISNYLKRIEKLNQDLAAKNQIEDDKSQKYIDKIKSLKEKLKIKEGELEEFIKKNSPTNRKFVSFSVELFSRYDELQQKSDKLREMQDQIFDKDRNIADLMSEIERLKEIIATNSKNHESLTITTMKKLEDMSSDLVKLKDENDKLKHELEFKSTTAEKFMIESENISVCMSECYEKGKRSAINDLENKVLEFNGYIDFVENETINYKKQSETYNTIKSHESDAKLKSIMGRIRKESGCLLNTIRELKTHNGQSNSEFSHRFLTDDELEEGYTLNNDVQFYSEIGTKEEISYDLSKLEEDLKRELNEINKLIEELAARLVSFESLSSSHLADNNKEFIEGIILEKDQTVNKLKRKIEQLSSSSLNSPKLFESEVHDKANRFISGENSNLPDLASQYVIPGESNDILYVKDARLSHQENNFSDILRENQRLRKEIEDLKVHLQGKDEEEYNLQRETSMEKQNQEHKSKLDHANKQISLIDNDRQKYIRIFTSIREKLEPVKHILNIETEGFTLDQIDSNLANIIDTLESLNIEFCNENEQFSDSHINVNKIKFNNNKHGQVINLSKSAVSSNNENTSKITLDIEPKVESGHSLLNELGDDAHSTDMSIEELTNRNRIIYEKLNLKLQEKDQIINELISKVNSYEHKSSQIEEISAHHFEKMDSSCTISDIQPVSDSNVGHLDARLDQQNIEYDKHFDIVGRNSIIGDHIQRNSHVFPSKLATSFINIASFEPHSDSRCGVLNKRVILSISNLYQYNLDLERESDRNKEEVEEKDKIIQELLSDNILSNKQTMSSVIPDQTQCDFKLIELSSDTLKDIQNKLREKDLALRNYYNEVSDKNKYIEELTHKLQEERDSYNNIKLNLQRRIDELQGQNKSLKKRVSDASSSRSHNLQLQKEGIIANYESIMQSNLSKDQIINELEKNVSETRDQLIYIQKEKDKEIQDLLKKLGSLDLLIISNSNEISQLNDQILSKDKRISLLEESCAHKDDKIKNLENNFSHTIKDFECKLNDAEKEVDYYRRNVDELHRMINDKDSDIIKLNSIIDTLNKQNKEIGIENQVMKEDVKLLSKEVNILDANVSEKSSDENALPKFEKLGSKTLTNDQENTRYTNKIDRFKKLPDYGENIQENLIQENHILKTRLNQKDNEISELSKELDTIKSLNEEKEAKIVELMSQLKDNYDRNMNLAELFRQTKEDFEIKCQEDDLSVTKIQEFRSLLDSNYLKIRKITMEMDKPSNKYTPPYGVHSFIEFNNAKLIHIDEFSDGDIFCSSIDISTTEPINGTFTYFNLAYVLSEMEDDDRDRRKSNKNAFIGLMFRSAAQGNIQAAHVLSKIDDYSGIYENILIDNQPLTSIEFQKFEDFLARNLVLDENKAFRRSIDDLRKMRNMKLVDKMDQIDSDKLNIATANTKIDQLKSELENVNELLKNSKNEKLMIMNELEIVRSDSMSYKKETESLVLNLQNTINLYKDDIEAKKLYIDFLESENTNLKKQVSKIGDESLNLSINQQDATESIKTGTRANDFQLKYNEGEISKLKEENQEYIIKLKQQTLFIDELKEKLQTFDTFKSDNVKKQEKINSLEAIINDLMKKLEEKSVLNDKHLSTISEKQSEINKLNQYIVDIKEGFAKDLDKLNDYQNSIEARNALCAKLIDKEAEVAELKRQISDFEKLNNELTLEVQNARKHYEVLTVRLSEKDGEFANLQIRLNEMERIKTQLRDSCSRTENDNSYMKNKIEDNDSREFDIAKHLDNVHRLEDSIKKLEEKLIQKESEVNEVISKLEDKDHENDRLSLMLIECDSEKEGLSSKIQEQFEQNQALTDEIENMNSTISELNQQLDDLKLEKHEIEETNKKLSEEHSKLKKNCLGRDLLMLFDCNNRVSSLMEENNKLKETIEIKDRVNQKMHEEVNIIKNQLKQLTLDYTKKNQEVSLLEQCIKQSEKDKLDLDSENVRLKEKLEELVYSTEVIRNKNEDLLKKIKEKEVENNSLVTERNQLSLTVAQYHKVRSDLEEAEQNFVAKDDENIELKAKINEIQGINDVIVSKIGDSREQHDIRSLFDEKFSILNNELECIREQLKASDERNKDKDIKIISLNEEITLLNDTLNDRNNQIEQLNNNINTLKVRIDESDKQIFDLNALNADFSELQVKNEELTKELEELSMQNDSLKKDFLNIEHMKDSRISELRFELNRLTSLLADKTSENASLYEKFDELNQEIEKKDSDLKNAEILLKDTSKQLKLATSEVHDKSKLVEQLNIEIETNKKEIFDRESEINDLSKEIRDRLIEINQKDSQLKKLSNELHNIYSNNDNPHVQRLTSEIKELNVALETKDSIIEQSNEHIRNIESQLSEIDDKMNRLKANNLTLTTKFNTLNQQLEYKDELLSTKDNRIKLLESQLDSVHSELSKSDINYSGEISDIGTLLDTIKALKGIIAEKDSLNKEQGQIYHSAIKDLEKEKLKNKEYIDSIRTLKSQIDLLNNDNVNLKIEKQRFDDISDERERLLMEILALSTDLKNKDSEIDRLKKEAEQDSESLRNKCESLTVKLDDTNELLSQLRFYLNQIHKENQQLRYYIDSLPTSESDKFGAISNTLEKTLSSITRLYKELTHKEDIILDEDNKIEDVINIDSGSSKVCSDHSNIEDQLNDALLENEKLKKIIQEREKVIQDRSELDNQTGEINSLRNMVSQLSEQLSCKESELVKHKAEIQGIFILLERFIKEGGSSDSLEADASQGIYTVEEQSHILDGQLNNFNEVRDHYPQIETLKSYIEDKNREIKKIEAKFKEQTDDLIRELELKSDEYNKAKETEKSCLEKVRLLTHEFSLNTDSLKEVEKDNQLLKDYWKDLLNILQPTFPSESKYEEIEDIVTVLTDKNNNSSTKCNIFDLVRESVESLRHNQEETNKQLNQLKTLEENIREKETQISTLQIETEGQLDQIKTLNQELKEKEKQFEIIKNSELAAQQLNIMNLQSQVEDLSKTLDMRNDEVRILKDLEIPRYHSLINDLLDQVKEICINSSEVENMSVMLEHNIDNFDTDTGSNNTIEKVLDPVNEIQTVMECLKRVIQDKDRIIIAHKENDDNVTERLNAIRTHISKLQIKDEKLTVQDVILESNINVIIDNLESKVQSLLKNVEEVKILNDQLDVKELQIAEFRSNESELLSKIKIFENNLINKTDEINSYERSKHVMIDQIDQLKRQIDYKDEEISKLNDLSINKDYQISQLKEYETSFESLNEEYKRFIDQKANETKELEDNNNYLNTKVQELLNTLSSKDTEIENLNNEKNTEVENLRKEIEYKSNNLVKLEEKLKELEASTLEMTNTISDKDSQLLQKIRDNDEFKRKEKTLQERLHIIQKQLESKDQEIIHLKEENENQIDKNKMDKKENQRILKEKADEFRVKEKQLNKELSNEVSKAKQKDALIKQLEDELMRKNNEILDLNEKHSKLMEQFKSLSSERNVNDYETINKFGELNYQIQELQYLVNSTESENKRLRQSEERLNKKLLELNEEIDNIRVENEKLEDKVTESAELIDELKEENDMRHKEIDEFAKRHDDDANRLTELLNSLDASNKEITSLKDDLLNNSEKKDILKQLNQRLSVELEKLKGQFVSKCSELESLKDLYDNKIVNKNQSIEKLEKCCKERDDIIRKNGYDNKRLKDENERLKTELTESKNLIHQSLFAAAERESEIVTDLRDQLSKAKTLLDSQNNQINCLNDEIKILNDKIHGTEDKNLEFESTKIKQLEVYINDLKDQLDEERYTSQKQKEYTDNLERMNEEFQHKMSIINEEYNNTVQKLSDELTMTNNVKDRLERENVELKERLTNMKTFENIYDSKVYQLESVLENSDKNEDHQEHEHIKENQKLKEKLESTPNDSKLFADKIYSENRDLKDKLDDLVKENNTFKDENAELKDTIKMLTLQLNEKEQIQTQKIKELTEQYTQNIKNLQSQNEKLTEEIGKLIDSNREKDENIEKIKSVGLSKIGKQRQLLEQTDKENKLLKELNNSNNAKLIEQQQNILQLEDELQLIKERENNSNLKEELKHAKHTIKLLENERNSLQNSLKIINNKLQDNEIQYSADKDRIQSQITATINDVEKYKKAVRFLKEKLDRSYDDYESLKTSFRKASEENNNLLVQIGHYRQKYTDVSSEISTEDDDQIISHGNTLSELRARLITYEAEIIELKKQLRESNANTDLSSTLDDFGNI